MPREVAGEAFKHWCDTCEGSGSVHQEHQAGCHVGGDYPCPDCDGKGYWTRAALSAPPADPLVMFPNVDGKDNDVLYPERTPVAAVAQPLKYVPVGSGLRDRFHNHPNDDEPRTPACRAALIARGDSEGQGLDGYWKWGFAAGFNAALSAAVAQPVAITDEQIDAFLPANPFGGAALTHFNRAQVRQTVRAALAASPSSERQDVGGGE